MANSSIDTTLREGCVHTLAQSGTKKAERRGITVIGKGSEMLDSEISKKKAKQKTIAQTLSISLVDVAKQKNKPYLAKQAWNTYHCLSNIVFEGGKLYGRYCKNRFCPTCSNIRKAQEIEKYKPIIENWDEPYFVTLTVKACAKNKLNATIKAMFKAFRNIQDIQKKREARNGDFHLMGIRSLECNFNPVKSSYNPHFHLIVPNRKTAEFLIESWLKRVGKDNANRLGQICVK